LRVVVYIGKSVSYKHPPVHEVILDLQFDGDADLTKLKDAAEAIAAVSDFKGVAERHTLDTSMLIGSVSHTAQTSTTRPAGFTINAENGAGYANLFKAQLTLHEVRSSTWPVGSYAGWDVISDRFFSIMNQAAVAYNDLKIRRVGLRYVNRIALPLGSPIDSWFNFLPTYPSNLQGVFNFSYSQTWANTHGHQDVATTVNMARIEVPAEQANSHIGVMLDIDIFNMWPKDAPIWEECKDWFSRAHDCENSVFEEFITDDLREEFY
jgi:uncharacterized protein (TIGR04255 family)